MQSFLLHWNFLERIRNHFKLSYTNDKVGGMIKSLGHDLFSIVVIQPFTPIYSFRLGLNLSIIGKFRFFCRSYREFYFSIYITQKTQHLKGILENIKLTVVKVMAVLIFNNNFSDATTYAHHVFKAFDVTSCGSISFKVRKNILICN